ncbi:MAG: tRNA (adenosine(37)-N6)-threonylcarbamoyltransferase complex transferase subunit TsaD [Eubacteriales bacterium]
MRILSFESSCDETSCAVVDYIDGIFTVRANIVASQIDIHARFGGVVPEIASRAHCETISKITYEALEKAGSGMDDIDAVAVTSFPGLIGALLVGVNFAKALAYAYGKPLVAVDHMKGHIAANYITHPDLKPPFLALIASGGHTSFVIVRDYTDTETVGSTRDDAMGEAFDKVARVMGMPYPGGAALDKLAYNGKPVLHFPSSAIAGDTLDMSFSGIKTSVLNFINSYNQKGEPLPREDIASSFVHAAVSGVIEKLSLALDKYPEIRSLALAGGVAANSHLRAAVKSLSERRGVKLYLPELCYCGDNGAMIAVAGAFEYLAGRRADIFLNASAADM